MIVTIAEIDYTGHKKWHIVFEKLYDLIRNHL